MSMQKVRLTSCFQTLGGDPQILLTTASRRVWKSFTAVTVDYLAANHRPFGVSLTD